LQRSSRLPNLSALLVNMLLVKKYHTRGARA